MTGPEQGKQLLLFRENLNVSRRGAEGVEGNIDKFKSDKKKLKKLHSFKRYEYSNFEFSTIFLLFLEIWQISTCDIFLVKNPFKIIFHI